MTDESALAVVVERTRTGAAIESLRREGVYDDDRRVRPYDEHAGTNAVPVTEPPTETAVLECVRQLDPDYRTRTLTDVLRARGWSDDALETVPGSWAIIGSVILVRVPADCPDETDLAEALLELHGEADSVLADEGISNDGEAGIYRTPKTRLLAGSSQTETVHVEAGTRYGLDPMRVMFSPGNQAERRRMGDVVEPGEQVFDMFAGIGYFTLPMARARACVHATELNPIAFRYLIENVLANDVTEQVAAYHTDCRELAGTIQADRVVMGYYGVAETIDTDTDTDTDEHDVSSTTTRSAQAHTFLPAALEALEPGGVVHYHEATPESRLWERPLERLSTAVERAGRELEILERRRVKTHSAGVVHVVLDGKVS